MSRAKADLSTLNSEGQPLQNAVIAYKETDGTTALAAALYTANSGGAATTIHETNSKGELTRFADYAQRAYYTINGDSVLWPVDFEVDPADVLATASDGVTITRGYRTLARLKVAALEAQIRDTGGVELHLEAFADNPAAIRGASPTEDPDIAWTRALAAITAMGGAGTVVLGPHRYLAPTAAVTMISNLVIRGSGVDATVIQHRNASQRPALALYLLSNVHVRDLTVDGNRTNNNGATTGFIDGEISFWGSDNSSVVNCKVTNFNFAAILGGGTNQTIACNFVDGPMLDPAQYVPNIDGITQRDCGGLLGIFCQGSAVPVRETLIFGNTIKGTRANGLAYGGVGLRIIGNDVRETHRGDWAPGTGGGQIAPTMTYSPTLGDIGQVAEQVVIADNVIGATTVGTYASGIEANPVHGLVIADNVIAGQPVFGIYLGGVESTTINGGEIANCTYGLWAASDVHAVTSIGWSMNGVSFRGNTTRAVTINDPCDSFSITNCVFKGNTANWLQGSTGTKWTTFGNRVVDGDVLPTYHGVNYAGAASTSDNTWAAVLKNAGVGTDGTHTGNGLQVYGGTTGFDFALRVRTAAGGDLFSVFGNGGVQVWGSGARIKADLSNATQASRTLFQTSTANGPSSLGVLPNGTNTTAGFAAYNSTDPDNAGLLSFTAGSTAVAITSGKTGAGATLPLQVFTNNTLRASFEWNGDVVVGAAALATNATAGFLFVETCAGTPTGVPAVSYTGRVPIIYDTTAHKIWVYDGGAWKATSALT